MQKRYAKAYRKLTGVIEKQAALGWPSPEYFTAAHSLLSHMWAAAHNASEPYIIMPLVATVDKMAAIDVAAWRRV